MVDILIITLLFLCIKVNNSFKIDGEGDIINAMNKSISPNSSKTFILDYKNETAHFSVNIKDDDSDLQINIYSFDCNIEIYPQEKIKKQINLNTYSLIINSAIKDIYIKPLKDIVDGKDKENYGAKSCFLSINSYYITNGNQQELNIKNNEENFIYFNPDTRYDSFHISYDIKNISINSFASLNFIIEEPPLDIDIYCIGINNEIKSSISKMINESTFIYLDSEFLLNNSNIGDNISLSIQIKNIKTNSTLFFKIIEENNVCLLAKNNLNFGFLTSKSTYQYYYTEVLKGEEGELMLHNKRLYGVLYAKIVDKNDIKDINNKSNYPYDNETKLEYDPHNLQLKFNYINTEHCSYGCYLLITYKQIKSNDDFPNIGYEYTILSRFWNRTDYISKIIDLFYNEYYINCFFHGSTPEHYYSVYVPNDAEKIIIQLEGNYLQAFYEEGRKRINTMEPIVKYHKFNIKENKNVFILDIKRDLNFTEERAISFAFRPKDYFSEIFSYYYFRVLYTKKNEIKYLPIDSNFGNLCIPEESPTTLGKYFCNLKLKNDYNELKTKFAVSSTNHNEHVRIYITVVFNDKTQKYLSNDFVYVYDNTSNSKDIDYYLFKFEFTNNEIKSIISSFFDTINNTNPQVYSAQMYYLDNNQKTNYFKLKYNYYFKLQYIYGESGTYKISFPYVDNFIISQNFKGKPITIPIDNNIDNFSFKTDSPQHIFYFQLIYNMKMKGIEEVRDGEPLTQFIKEFAFPLYFYLKIKGEENIVIDANIRLKSFLLTQMNDKYIIKGYIINENILNRKINGEYIKFEDPIEGTYSDAFGMGLLQVNKKIDNTGLDKYLLMEIDNMDKSYLNLTRTSLMEISTKEYDENKEYTLPINKYVIETFNGKNNEIRKENEYYIFNPKGNTSQTMIELSTENEDIKIDFGNYSNYEIKDEKEKGFKKYIITDRQSKLNFKVTNYNQTAANYLIKYSYHDINDNTSLIFDEKYIGIINNHSDTVDISLMFNPIKMKTFSKLLENRGVTFLISGTLSVKNEKLNKLINTNYILYENKSGIVNRTIGFYNITITNYTWTLEFNNIPRNDNYIYDLALQVNAILLDNIIHEKILLYKTKVDLTGIKIENQNGKKSKLWIYIVVTIIILIIIIFLIIKFLRLKKKNDNLQKEMKTLAFSNDIQNNVLIKEQKLSKKESDYETTFI